MARALCQSCLKALPACICASIKQINNQYFLHILQDPSEEKKAIGTARILALSLLHSKISVGALFDESLFDLENSFLVFPSEDAQPVDSLVINKDSQFIILDGSWKKAYKLLMSNPFLQKLPKVSICVDKKSEYRIRKSPRQDGLSTVEAGYALLNDLENDSEKFQPLLDSFTSMIDYQIAQMPADIYQKNYVDKQGKN